MKTYELCALVGFMLVTPSLFAQTNAAATTPIPEEARKHFVMGETMFKEAKAPGDFVQAENEFKQATDVAPQWPDARYNLALAKEAAGNYSGAMADLKLYQQFKLTDAEARTVQDKIYAIEAKQKMAVDAANSPAAQLEKLVQSLDGGVWRCVSSTSANSIGGGGKDGDVGHTYIAVSGHTMYDRSPNAFYTDSKGYIHVRQNVDYDPNANPGWAATITGRTFNAPEPRYYDYSPYSDEVTIGDDGRSIKEEMTGTNDSFTVTLTRTYERIK